MKSIRELYERHKQLAEPKPRKKRPGTKPKGPYEDKRAALTTRITQETRTALEGAARTSGRSLSQEIEFRLVQSIRDEDGFGGNENAALFRMLGAAASLVEARTGNSWLEDWDTSLAVQTTWKQIITQVGGRPSKELLDEFRPSLYLEKLPKMPELPAHIHGPGLSGKLGTERPSEADIEMASAETARYLKEIKIVEKAFATKVMEMSESVKRMEHAVGLGNDVFNEFNEMFPARK